MPISRPLFALLLLSAVLSVVTVLTPPPEDTDNTGDELLAERRPVVSPAGAVAEQPLRPWQRPGYHRVLTAMPSQAVVTQPTVVAAPPPPVWVEPPQPSEPARPSAPQPEFRYLGRLVRDDAAWVFITQGENQYAVRLGNTFEGKWRFEDVTPQSLVLRYLPLNQTRTLSLSE